MKKTLLTLMAAAFTLTAVATDYDLNKPFGFCTVSSRTDATSTYNITGGGCYTYPVPDGFTGRVTVLPSDGPDVDMKAKIQNGIKNNEVLILDGSNGDFYVSSNIGNTFSNRTIINTLYNKVAIVDDRIETIPCIIECGPCSTEVIVHVTALTCSVE